MPFLQIDRVTLVTFPLFWLFITLCIAVHEAAHAVAAFACGVTPGRIIIGVGPRRWTWRRTIRGIPMSVGPYPIVGAVELGDFTQRGPAWKRILVLLAGPGANIALAAVMLVATNGLQILPSFGRMLLQFPQASVQAVAYVARHPINTAMFTGTDPASSLTVAGFTALFAVMTFGMGLLNLAPFPPLDGGNIVLAVLDGVGLGHPLVRYVLLGIGLTGVAVLTLPTLSVVLSGMAVDWRGFVGANVLAIALGLGVRQWRWYSHRRWGTPPPPPLFRSTADPG